MFRTTSLLSLMLDLFYLFAGILRGNVNFAENRHLCFVNTIKWSDIFEDNLTQEAHISGSASSCKKISLCV